jgi:hypothetical protein
MGVGVQVPLPAPRCFLRKKVEVIRLLPFFLYNAEISGENDLWEKI